MKGEFKKLFEGLRGRKGLIKRIEEFRFSCQRAPLWFHVASSGEFEQALPILERIRNESPELPLFLSYFSPSAKRAIQLEKQRRGSTPLPFDASDYAPLDLPHRVSGYLTALKPQRLVIINRELWPNLVKGCVREDIPLSLFAVFLSPKNQKRWRWYRGPLSHFESVGSVDDATTQFLQKEMPSLNVKTLGDPRLERVIDRKNSQKPASWAEHFKDQNVFVAGSLWPKDWAMIRGGIKDLSDLGWRVILVSHDMDRQFIEEMATSLRASLWSNWIENPNATDHLVVDRVGLLAELYQVATLAFVGGSFGQRVHNVLEPAAYGCPILTGPDISNSNEAVFLSRTPGLHLCQSGDEFSLAVRDLAKDSKARALGSQALKAFLESGRTISRDYTNTLLP